MSCGDSHSQQLHEEGSGPAFQLIDGQHRVGLLVATRLISHGLGSGRAEGLLHTTLLADRAVDALATARRSAEGDCLTRRLLATVEADTSLPAITTPVGHAGLPPAQASPLALDCHEIARAEPIWRMVHQVARVLLQQAVGVRPPELTAAPPPTPASPCGVIGMAATRIPRAPGRPAHHPPVIPSPAAAAA